MEDEQQQQGAGSHYSPSVRPSVIMKNLTRLSSAILGTWSTWTHLSAHIPGLGRYEVMAYFVVHFVPDPTRPYACSDSRDSSRDSRDSRDGISSSSSNIGEADADLDAAESTESYSSSSSSSSSKNCREWDNMYCQVTHEELKHAQPRCFNMSDPRIVSSWSDVSAYYSIGISMSAGFPFNFENEHRDTGSDAWIGPYSIVLAQKEEEEEDDDNVDHNTFAIRYVRTPSTPHLQRYPTNQTLFPYDGYLQSFGPQAVAATIQQQAMLRHGDDPFVLQHATCQNGNITPILPLYQFSSSNKKKRRNTKMKYHSNEYGGGGDDDKDDDNHDHDWDVQVDYRALISPSTENLSYKWMPWIQKQVNKRALGFTVDGPYCYFDDPNRAYVNTFETLLHCYVTF
jgi:hypothetical protein